MSHYNDVYILGVATYPATLREDGRRLEELVYDTSRRAHDHAGINRRQLDNVVLGACDELDGRPISSMLMTAPAGGYLTDEIKVTDCGAMALCLEYARIRSGEFNIGLVASWCKSSKTDVSAVMRLRGDPFFTRPLGLDGVVTDALFAQAVAGRYRIDAAEASQRAAAASQRGASNPRGLQAASVSAADVAASSYLATPLRSGHRATLSDGAVSLVVASQKFLRDNPACKPLARMTGAGWASDSYRLDAQRLASLGSARKAWGAALRLAGLSKASDFDVIELESPTSWHEAAWVRAFEIEDESSISPSGGTFAQNPLFCSGLVNAAEAVLQVAGQAGAVQRNNVRRAAAHSCHGYAQQGNVVMTFEKVLEKGAAS